MFSISSEKHNHPSNCSSQTLGSCPWKFLNPPLPHQFQWIFFNLFLFWFVTHIQKSHWALYMCACVCVHVFKKIFAEIITKHNPCNQHSGHQIGDCQDSRKPSLNSLLLKSNLCLEFYDNYFLNFLPKVAFKLVNLILPTFSTLYKWNHIVYILYSGSFHSTLFCEIYCCFMEL